LVLAAVDALPGVPAWMPAYNAATRNTSGTIPRTSV
jgi:hypothetical protein